MAKGDSRGYPVAMKHAELRAIVHNVADSLASGIGLLIGVYEIYVFEEASHSPGASITVDFLSGSVREGECTPLLSRAAALYREALADLCAKAGGSVAELVEARAGFWSDALGPRFAVTIEDARGCRSTTEYAGIPGKRVKVMDGLGRVRPKLAAH